LFSQDQVEHLQAGGGIFADGATVEVILVEGGGAIFMELIGPVRNLGQMQKIREQSVPPLRQHRLGMELHAPDWQLFMLNGHDDAIGGTRLSVPMWVIGTF